MLKLEPPSWNTSYGPNHSFETRTGPLGQLRLKTGLGLSKNPPESWPGETWSTQWMGQPGSTRLGFKIMIQTLKKHTRST